MNDGQTTLPTKDIDDLPGSPFADTIWSRVDDALSLMGDALNPILVKETRQALKSRQFTASFWLVLICAAGWSFIAISLMMPYVYYFPSGKNLLAGYYVILAIPLLLVVPFSAFRSLATERDDGTYELLSITSLSARQIVTGKLGSALMQMLVYLAALAPCIAFTYLLRGLDLGTIVVVIVGTFLASILFSCVGLVFAGLHRSRQWQALTSVLLLLLLIVGGWSWGFLMMSLVFEGGTAVDQAEFWYGVGFVISMYAGVTAMLIQIAAAQNSFVTDNRSTAVRFSMLAQLVLFTGWMSFMWMTFSAEEILVIALVGAGVVWTLYGIFLTGDLGQLSPRARRKLPQSFVGRMFLTWFNPGSATGYVFTVTSFLAFVVLILAANTFAAANEPGMAYDVEDLSAFGLLLWSYLAFYLGTGRLIIMALKRVADVGIMAVLLIQVLVLIIACALPTFIQFWMQNFRDLDYSNLQMINWFWTLIETINGSWVMWPAVLTMGSAAMAMFALNLVLAAREVETTRLVAPVRVMEDDAEQSEVVLLPAVAEAT